MNVGVMKKMTVKELVIELIKNNDLNSQVLICSDRYEKCENFVVYDEKYLDEGGMMLYSKHPGEESFVILRTKS